jgi:biotin carboxyl carrier protein
MALQLKIAGNDFAAELLPTGGGGRIWVDQAGYDAKLTMQPDGSALLLLNGREFPVHVACDGDTAFVHAFGRSWEVSMEGGAKVAAGSKDDVITAPMPGMVIDMRVKAGDRVAKGQAMLVIESMKMQTEILAGRTGVVAEVPFAAGDAFGKGAPLVRLEKEEK